jgi:hypothetical protein
MFDDNKINHIMEKLIENKCPTNHVSLYFSEEVYDELQQNFFNNGSNFNFLLLKYFIKQILPEDITIYIANIFFNLFINNKKLEEITESILIDYHIGKFKRGRPEMELKYHPKDNKFGLDIGVYLSFPSILENCVSLSSDETYKFLYIILNANIKNLNFTMDIDLINKTYFSKDGIVDLTMKSILNGFRKGKDEDIVNSITALISNGFEKNKTKV